MSRDKMHVALGDVEMSADEEREFIKEKMKAQK